MDAAEKSAREAVRLDTRKQFLSTIRLLGVILAQNQDYAGAVRAVQSLSGSCADRPPTRRPCAPS